jgi:hypothetical protein
VGGGGGGGGFCSMWGIYTVLPHPVQLLVTFSTKIFRGAFSSQIFSVSGLEVRWRESSTDRHTRFSKR